MSDDLDTDAIKTRVIVEMIKPILAGKGHAIQSAVLADLLSMWLAGHYPEEIREELLADHLVLVRALIPINEAQIWEGHPVQ